MPISGIVQAGRATKTLCVRAKNASLFRLSARCPEADLRWPGEARNPSRFDKREEAFSTRMKAFRAE
jgi:hypothetical protein